MLEHRHVISKNELTSKIWSFSEFSGPILDNVFVFGASGSIEVFSNDNERNWLLEEGTVKILRADGVVMWESYECIREGQALRISLRSPLHSNMHFVLNERVFGRQPTRVLDEPAGDRHEPMTAAEFLFPTDLQVTPTPISKVLMLGSCMSQLYMQFLRNERPDIEFDFILFNYAGVMPEKTPSPITDYGFLYVQIPLPSVVTTRVIFATELNSAEFVKSILNDGYAIIDTMLESALVYTKAHGLPAMVSNFFVPQTNLSASVHQRGTPHDLSYLIACLNDYLALAVAQQQNAYLCDVNMLGSSFGKRFFLDDVISFSSHNSLLYQEAHDMQPHERIEQIPPMSTFYETRWRELFQAMLEQAISCFRTVRQIDQVKAVIFDLDHTLWRGQIAEDYRPGLEEFPSPSPWQIGLWNAIHHLRARGILVAICSKNDIEVVRANWENVVTPSFLKLADFASIKINWLPKAENIRDICAEFNIKPKSVVFVDDNPIERAAVKAELPSIRVIGSNPYLTRRILLWSAETQIAHLTEESRGRETAIRGQIVREDTRRTTLSRSEFLQTLACQVTFTPITDIGQPEFTRALELTNKTNQFNTTGLRWTHGEIQQFLIEGGEVLSFRVKDRFAEYGLVGAIFIKSNIIVQMVMSCRVLGMEIEQCAIAYAIDRINTLTGQGQVFAQLRETADNGPCRETFPRLGFEETKADGDVRRFLLNPLRVIQCPSHITVLSEGGAFTAPSVEQSINLVFDGDSIAVGLGASQEKTLAMQVGRLLRGHNTLHVVAQGGRQLSHCLATFDQQVAALYNTDAQRNIVFLKAGDNDVTQGKTAEKIHEDLMSYVKFAHNNGWEIIVSSNLQRYDISNDLQQELSSFNEMTVANSAGADAVIDLAGDSILGGRERRDDLFYYTWDQVHPADAGYTLIAKKVISALHS